MRNKVLAIALAVVMSMAYSVFAADTYVVDASHSSISFAVRHMGLAKVRGGFTNFSVAIQYDEKDLTKSSVQVTIKTASINTGNEGRDNHLRSPDFFDVEKYPEITFVSEKIEKKEDGFVAHGTLTMHGVAKHIGLPFNLIGPIKDMQGGMRLAVEAETKLNRQDYGVTWSKTLDAGGLVVGNEITVEIQAEAVKE